MKKICFLTNNWNQMGGIERVISVLSSGLIKANVKVTLLSLYSKTTENSFFTLPDEIECIHAGLSIGEKTADYLVRYFAENRFDDLVTFHAGIALMIARIIKKIRPVRWIATEHCDPNSYTWKRQLINLLVYKKADVLVVLTDNSAEYYRKRLIDQTIVIPNPVSFTCSEACRYSKTVLAVGRVEEIKRFDVLIKAFGSLEEKYPDWKLNIVGSGSQFDGLLLEASKYKNIVLLGNRNDVPELMLDSSFLVITSRYEGFSLVALEALECGLPIISTPLPSVQSITKGYDVAVFTAHDDWEDLADKIEYLILNPSEVKRMGAEAKKCAKQYSTNSVVSRWVDVL